LDEKLKEAALAWAGAPKPPDPNPDEGAAEDPNPDAGGAAAPNPDGAVDPNPEKEEAESNPVGADDPKDDCCPGLFNSAIIAERVLAFITLSS